MSKYTSITQEEVYTEPLTLVCSRIIFIPTTLTCSITIIIVIDIHFKIHMKLKGQVHEKFVLIKSSTILIN